MKEKERCLYCAKEGKFEEDEFDAPCCPECKKEINAKLDEVVIIN